MYNFPGVSWQLYRQNFSSFLLHQRFSRRFLTCFPSCCFLLSGSSRLHSLTESDGISLCVFLCMRLPTGLAALLSGTLSESVLCLVKSTWEKEAQFDDSRSRMRAIFGEALNFSGIVPDKSQHEKLALFRDNRLRTKALISGAPVGVGKVSDEIDFDNRHYPAIVGWNKAHYFIGLLLLSVQYLPKLTWGSGTSRRLLAEVKGPIRQ